MQKLVLWGHWCLNTHIHGSGIEPITFALWGNGTNHWATVLRRAAIKVIKEKKTGPLRTCGPVRCRNTASMISNQAFSCGQSGPSHVAPSRTLSLPAKHNNSMPGSQQLAHICLFVPLGSNENKLKSKWFPAWMLPFGNLPVEVRFLFFFNGMMSFFSGFCRQFCSMCVELIPKCSSEYIKQDVIQCTVTKTLNINYAAVYLSAGCVWRGTNSATRIKAWFHGGKFSSSRGNIPSFFFFFFFSALSVLYLFS